MTYIGPRPKGKAMPSPLSVGERVVVVPRTGVLEFIGPHPVAVPGDAGTVSFIHLSPRGRNAVYVRLDRTEREAILFEAELAPEPDTP